MTQFTFDTALTLVQSSEQFPVNFDDAWVWLGYSRKDSALLTLKHNFKENIDFSCSKRKNPNGGRPSDKILITIDCFKSWAIIVNTKKGKEVRQYLCEELRKYDELKQKGLSLQEFRVTTDLISIYKGQLVTDSITLASTFKKEHKYILREIGVKLSQSTDSYINNFYQKHFIKCTYLDSYKREQTKYLLTREGFSLLALGFTGEQAELFKIQYIEAFESMYKKLEGYALATFFRDTTEKQFVYVIRNTITGLIKIGVTNNIKRRINQLECATGCELETVYCSVIADNAKEIEKHLHEKFADFRQRGEWFDINPDIVINSIAHLSFILEPIQP